MTTQLAAVSEMLAAPRSVDHVAAQRGQWRLAGETVTAANVRAVEAVDPTLSLPEMQVLILLRSGSPDDVRDVADQLGVDGPEADRSCDRLVAAGHVVRRDESAQRHLALTSRGRHLAEQLITRREQELSALVGRMSELDIRRLIRALEEAEPEPIRVSRSARRR